MSAKPPVSRHLETTEPWRPRHLAAHSHPIAPKRGDLHAAAWCQERACRLVPKAEAPRSPGKTVAHPGETVGMTSESLPVFRYYRDPIAAEVVERSEVTCAACGEARGFIVTSTSYGEGVPEDAAFCPWCVADGTAHRCFGVTFNQVGLGAPPAVVSEVRERTPGVFTWQDWSWPTHCNDAAVYVGEPSADELRGNLEAHEALLVELRQWDWGRDEEHVRGFIDGLGGSQVVYLFECRHCHAQLLRWDMG